MKRQLEQRLYLMVKRKSSGGWGFPAAENSASESIRQTADRALTATIGRRHPIYPIGNAPMGHLVSQADGSSTYFLLSQVVDDPWVVALSAAADAADYAWLTKAELLAADGGYVRDARLRELLSKMLAA